jgi:hypothetical protein
MPGVTNLYAFRQQPLAPALTPPRESGAAAFGFHPRPKTVLTFPGAFRRLIGAFHARRAK